MNAKECMALATEQNIWLYLNDGKLKFKAEAGAMSPELKAQLSQHKQEIIDILKSQELASTNNVLATEIRPQQQSEAPLSFAQQRLWMIDQIQGGSPHYNIPVTLQVSGKFCLQTAEKAMSKIIARHSVLRSQFRQTATEVVQSVSDDIDFRLKVHDLQQTDSAEQQVLAEQLIKQHACYVFDLASECLVKAAYIKLSATEGICLINMHHIVSDGWSMGLFVKEFVTQYQNILNGLESHQPALKIQYSDYALWQRDILSGEVLDGQLDYWQKQLEDVPQTHSLPLDFPRPKVKAHAGKFLVQPFSAQTYKQIKSLAQQHAVTPYILLHALVSLVIAKHSNNNDVIVGTGVANRRHPDLEALIGFFINSLALRVNTDWASFSEYLAHVRQVNIDAQKNQDVPLETIIEQLGIQHSEQHTPLFQIIFTMDNNESFELSLPDVSFTSVDTGETTVKFDLVIRARESEGQLLLGWTYDTSLFTASTITKLQQSLERLLTQVFTSTEQPTSQLSVLTEQEVSTLHHGIAYQACTNPTITPFHRLFEQQALQKPDSIAVSCQQHSLTYQQLNEAANRLSDCLTEMGIGTGEIVAIPARRDSEMLVAILAVLKCGAAYTPVNPEQPQSRTQGVLEEANAEFILVWSSLTDQLVIPGIDLIIIDGCTTDGFVDYCSENPGITEQEKENLAYVLYTSGSTGKPKGVCIEHQQLSLYLSHCQHNYYGDAISGGVVCTPLTFDATITSLLAPLSSGKQVRLVPDEKEAMLSETLSCLMSNEQNWVFKLTPAHLLALQEMASDLPTVKAAHTLVIGGEQLTYAQLKPWMAKLPKASFVNEYGPTETTVGCITYTVSPGANTQDQAIVPIGHAIHGCRIYLLDQHLNPVPTGTLGEIVIGGAAVARGYLEANSNDSERFIDNPWVKGERLYRSGDFARLLPNGALEFGGRQDEQVKVRGYRIEPAEVEKALVEAGAETAIVSIQKDQSNQNCLIAHVVLGENCDNQELLKNIQQQAQKSLPDYMHPAALIPLNALPLTTNGKLDKVALANLTSPLSTERKAPSDSVEIMLHDIWKSVLKHENFGVQENFFELGGQSLLAIRVINRVQNQLDEIVHLAVMYDAPTITEFAEYLRNNYAEALDAKGILTQSGASNGSRLQKPSSLNDEALARFRALIPALPGNNQKQDKTVTAKNPKAVFLLSPPRSGSTLLRIMLAGHPEIFAPPELELLPFDTMGQRSKAFSGRFNFWLEGTIRALMQAKNIDAEQARQFIADCEAQNMPVKAFYRILQDAVSPAILLDKTPSYAYHPDILKQAEIDFKDAVYVHLIRHPGAMISSCEKAQLEQVLYLHDHNLNSVELAELLYTGCHTHINEFLKDIPENRQHAIYFEDLVANPKATMEALCQALDLPFHEAMLNPYDAQSERMTDGIHSESRMLGDVKFSQHGKLNEDAANAWRKRLNENLLSDTTWRIANSFGYQKKTVESNDISIPVLTDKSHVALSFAQQRLWFVDRLQNGAPEFNMPTCLKVTGELDLAAAETAISRIIERHESLRSHFAQDEQGPYQWVSNDWKFRLQHIDLSELNEEEKERRLTTLLQQEQGRIFDLSADLLVRASYFYLGGIGKDTQAILLFNRHHIASDGWSAGLLVNEFVSQYKAIVNGLQNPLPPLAVQYPDYAQWQRNYLQGENLENHLRYWENLLQDIPTCHSLPLDVPRGRERKSAGKVQQQLPAKLVKQLRFCADSNKCTLFMVMQAAFAVHLARLSHETDIVMGAPSVNRSHADLEQMIGLFLNTQLFRTSLGANPSFKQLLSDTRKQHSNSSIHNELPFEAIVERLNPPRNLDIHPLFQVFINLNNNESAALELDDISFEGMASASLENKYDLTFYIQEQKSATTDELNLVWVYDASLFYSHSMESYLQEYIHLLSSLLTTPEIPVLDHQWQQSSVSLQSPEEAKTQDIISSFEQQVRQNPEKIAIGYHDERISFAELNRRVNITARNLQQYRVTKGSRVAISVARNPLRLVQSLAVMKLGATSLTLSEELPLNRCQTMLSEASISHFISDTNMALDVSDLQVINCLSEEFLQQLAMQSADNLNTDIAPQDLVSIVFTSGSSGTAKGVGISHQALANRINWMLEEFDFNVDSVMAHSTSAASVVSLWESFGPLCAGSTVHICDRDTIRQPEKFLNLVATEQISHIKLIPSLLTTWMQSCSLKDYDLRHLRYCFIGGEMLLQQDAEHFIRQLPEVSLINLYGTTEVTADVLWKKARAEDSAPYVAAGQCLPGNQVWVLDNRGNPVPTGVVGEVHVQGIHVAEGYLNPELAHKTGFSQNSSEPTYATGDLGRVLTNGDIEILGRKDQQLKIRGFRVEPAETEFHLRQFANVEACTVVARSDTSGNQILVAYLVMSTKLDTAAVRQYLSTQLPDYMIPAVFVQLDEMPVTLSGKVDQNALPAPTALDLGQDYRPPSTEVEQQLVSIWSELLALPADRLSVNSNFFETGGHSLLAVRLIVKVKTHCEVDIDIRDIFDQPTIHQLGALIEQKRLIAYTQSKEIDTEFMSEGML